MTTREKTRKAVTRRRRAVARPIAQPVGGVDANAPPEQKIALALLPADPVEGAEVDAPACDFSEEIVPEAVPRGPRNLRELLATGRGEVELLSFRVGSEMFAVDLASVDEAVETTGVHPVPDMPPAMLGVLDLRGRLVPLFSPASVLRAVLAKNEGVMLVMRNRDRRVGIAVDDVEDVIILDLTGLQRPFLDGAADGVLLGVATTGTGLIGIVDADALVAACTEQHRSLEAA